jgi:glutamate racemase
LRRIQREYLPKYHPNKKVLGVILPAIETAVLKTRNKKIGVIATDGTVSSEAFTREILNLDKNVKVYQNACPLLVPIIEAGEHNSQMVEIVLRKYLKPLLDKKIDTLILGCTHYNLLENKIKKIVGGEVGIVSEQEIVGKKLKEYLSRHPEIDVVLSKKGKREFFSTDLTKKFEILGSKFFGEKIKVKKATI